MSRYEILLVSGITKALIQLEVDKIQPPPEVKKPTSAAAAAAGIPVVAKIERREKFELKNRLVLSVRGPDAHARSELMEKIMEQIMQSSERYSGVVLHQNVRSPAHPTAIINLAFVLAEIRQRGSDAIIMCPGSKKELKATELLDRAGFFIKNEDASKSQENEDTIRGRGHGSLADVFNAAPSQKVVIQNAKQLIKRGYPSVYFLLPSRSSQPTIPQVGVFYKSLLGLSADLNWEESEKLELYCFCEFQCRDSKGQMQACWHPTSTPGIKLENTPQRRATLAPVLKSSYTTLRNLDHATKQTRIPFPNAKILVEKLEEISENFKQPTSEVEFEDPKSSRPKLLVGESLSACKDVFGQALGGQLTKAGLELCLVEFDGPMGNVGDILWLCGEHANRLKQQNNHKVTKLHDLLCSTYDYLWTGEQPPSSNGEFDD